MSPDPPKVGGRVCPAGRPTQDTLVGLSRGNPGNGSKDDWNTTSWAVPWFNPECLTRFEVAGI